jgi:hypothetical protein
MSELGDGRATRINDASHLRVFGRFRADESDPSRSTHATCGADNCKSAIIKNKPNLFSPRNLAEAKKHAAKMLRRIKFAHIGGQKKLRDRLIVLYLQSMDARVVAVDEAYRSLPPLKRPGKKQLASIAGAIGPWQPA